MEDRKPSLDFGLGMNYKKDSWKFEVSSSHDVLDRSNGAELSTKIGKTFRIGPVAIEPVIGLSYQDSKFVDYYYGVEASEANSSRPEYDGDAAINRTLGVTFSTAVFLGGFTRITIENEWLDSSLTDSPLTDTDTSLKLLYCFSRFF
jgi:outer membrane protein